MAGKACAVVEALCCVIFGMCADRKVGATQLAGMVLRSNQQCRADPSVARAGPCKKVMQIHTARSKLDLRDWQEDGVTQKGPIGLPCLRDESVTPSGGTEQIAGQGFGAGMAGIAVMGCELCYCVQKRGDVCAAG